MKEKIKRAHTNFLKESLRVYDVDNMARF